MNNFTSPTRAYQAPKRSATIYRLLLLAGLPGELVDYILDLGEFYGESVLAWDALYLSKRRERVYNYVDEYTTRTRTEKSRYWYLLEKMIDNDYVTLPIPGPGRRVRRVSFEIQSCDQGDFGISRDTDIKPHYEDSWTWFEAAILRPVDSPFLQRIPQAKGNGLGGISSESTHNWTPVTGTFGDSEHSAYCVEHRISSGIRPMIQKNHRKSRSFRTHVNIWDIRDPTLDGEKREWLECLREGDMVAVVPKVGMSCWSNIVAKVGVRIEYVYVPE